MKCQILFSRKNKENISKCGVLKFLYSMQSVKISNCFIKLIAQILCQHNRDPRQNVCDSFDLVKLKIKA